MSMKTMLALTTRFHVSVDGVDLGGWARCKGLAVKFNPHKVKEGGNYLYQPVLPGNIDYPEVTLERAMDKASAAKVQAWLRNRAQAWVQSMLGAPGGTARITLFDSHAQEVTSWHLRNVYPSSWKGPDLDSTSLGVAMESLTLVHEGFL
ncbi:phage tail protein [Actinokineospora sp. NPDC004072]